MLTSASVPPPSSPPRSQASGRSGPRTRMGCLTCRRRKVRCDQSSATIETRRRCGNCVRLELECHFAPPDTPRKRPIRGNARGDSSSTNGIPAPTDTASANDGQPCICDPVEHSVSVPGAAAGLLSPPAGSRHLGYIPPHANTVDQMQLSGMFGSMPDLTGICNGPDWSSDAFPSGTANPISGLYASSLLPWKDFSKTGNDLMMPNTSTSRGISETGGNYNKGIAGTGTRQQPKLPIPASSEPHVSHSQSIVVPSPSPGIDLTLFDVTDHQRQLLLHFTSKANSIPLITPSDTQWKPVYSSLMSMACGCTHLINAICAVSELNLVGSMKGTVAQASIYYQSAATKAEAVLNLPGPRVDDRSLKQAFATLLLLMQAEIMAQPLAGHHTWPTTRLRRAYRHLKRHSERLRLWTGIGSHIISWIKIVDNKAVYSAGMDKDSDRPSTEPGTNSPCTPNGTATDASPLMQPSPSSDHSVHVPTDFNASNSNQCPITSPTMCDIPADSPLEESPSAAEIAYDALHEPAYKFFMRSQSLIPRIIALDPYHRSRGPLDDELKVLQLGQRLREELHDLWLKRPRVLGVLSDTEELQEVLHPRVARKVIRGFRSFVANFHAVTIFLHRVVFIQYPASEEVKLAIAEILRFAKEQLADEERDARLDTGNEKGCRGDGSNSVEEVRTPETRTGDSEPSGTGLADIYHQDARIGESQPAREEEAPSTGPHPVMLWLWPLFMCGTECSVEDRQWILERMYATRSVNAERTAMLLSELTRQQDETGRRVDQRTVRRKIFDDEFDVVY